MNVLGSAAADEFTCGRVTRRRAKATREKADALWKRWKQQWLAFG